MPTVVAGYAVKAVMSVGIRWEYEPLHLSILSDDGRLAPTPQRRLLNLTQIHDRSVSPIVVKVARIYPGT